ncbi:MAG: hypothetical protein ACTH6F_14470, partial [Halomonas sp.]
TSLRHPRKAAPAARMCRLGLEPHPTLTPAAQGAALRRAAAAGALRLHRTTIEPHQHGDDGWRYAPHYV